MVQLVLDTAQNACSVALVAQGEVVAERHIALARGHAEQLIPMVADMCAQAPAHQISAICVDIGPGSFTGLRVGLAAARAFGVAWGVPVLGYGAMRLAAAQAFAHDVDLQKIWVMLDAGRGQIYAALTTRDGAVSPIENLSPAQAAEKINAGDFVLGSGSALVRACTMQDIIWGDDMPAPASAARFLLPHDFTTDLQPLYVGIDAAVPA